MTVLFDLDGTLLPLDQEEFIRTYFKLVARTFAARGYEPKKLVETIYAGTMAMVGNDGGATNRERFWDTYAGVYGEERRADEALFDEFYLNEFNEGRAVCGYNAEAAALIRSLRERGDRLVLASNPIFPRVGQKQRMQWAGVDPDDFERITDYRNSHYCKSNPEYYAEILREQGIDAGDCVMVGNDASEDTPAERAGIKVFILTDCLINTKNIDIERYPHGSYPQLRRYLGL